METRQSMLQGSKQEGTGAWGRGTFDKGRDTLGPSPPTYFQIPLKQRPIPCSCNYLSMTTVTKIACHNFLGIHPRILQLTLSMTGFHFTYPNRSLGLEGAWYRISLLWMRPANTSLPRAPLPGWPQLRSGTECYRVVHSHIGTVLRVLQVFAQSLLILILNIVLSLHYLGL